MVEAGLMKQAGGTPTLPYFFFYGVWLSWCFLLCKLMTIDE